MSTRPPFDRVHEGIAIGWGVILLGLVSFWVISGWSEVFGGVAGIFLGAMLAFVGLFVLGVVTTGTATSVANPSATPTPAASTMQITSPAFDKGGVIPAKFTCEADDISPELRITGIPQEATVLALIVDDPDAPGATWDHWVEFDVPTSGPELVVSENAGQIGVPGLNSWSETGYGGPCPPPGTPHRYFFHVFALDRPLAISGSADSNSVRTAMEAHILAEAELMGTFGR